MIARCHEGKSIYKVRKLQDKQAYTTEAEEGFYMLRPVSKTVASDVENCLASAEAAALKFHSSLHVAISA